MSERQSTPLPVKATEEVAGFLVRDATRFRFVAADLRFRILDGSHFARLLDAERAVERLARLVESDGEPPRPRPL